MDADKINHEGGLPPYMQLAAVLRQRIEQGELTGRLPSEKHLAQQFGVSQSTVRKALALLAEAGLVEKHQGWGTRVLPPEDRPG